MVPSWAMARDSYSRDWPFWIERFRESMSSGIWKEVSPKQAQSSTTSRFLNFSRVVWLMDFLERLQNADEEKKPKGRETPSNGTNDWATRNTRELFEVL
jgi:hypothetical protein